MTTVENTSDARHMLSGTTTLGVAKIAKRIGADRFDAQSLAQTKSRFLMHVGGFDAFNKVQRWLVKNPGSLESAKARLEAKRTTYKERLKKVEQEIKELPNTYQPDPKVAKAQSVIGELDGIFANAEMGIPDQQVLKTKGMELVRKIQELVEEIDVSETKEEEEVAQTSS